MKIGSILRKAFAMKRAYALVDSMRDQFVNIELAQAGVLQYEFACRCDWACGETDCSGLASGGARRVMGALWPYAPGVCPNSSELARWCHRAPRPQWMNVMFGPDPWTGRTDIGTGISHAQARATKGALKFHGDDQGMDGDGPTGHVGTSLGDGRSIEALSHALDVRIWEFDDSKTTYCALIPGMTGFDTTPGANPDPANAWEASVMGMIPIAVPGAHVQASGKAKGRMPLVAATSNDGITWTLVGFNGVTHIQQGGKDVSKPSGFGPAVALGKLNKPIIAAEVVYIEDPDDPRPVGQRHLMPTKQVLFSAADGGTFGPYTMVVKYG